MKSKIILVMLLMVAAITQAQFPGRLGGTSYENSNIGTGMGGVQTCCSYSLVRSADWKKQGNYSMKIRLVKGDPPVSSTNGGGYRAETHFNYPKVRTDVTWFRAWWYMPSATYAYDNQPEIIWQYHKGSGSPPVSIQTWRDSLMFVMFDIKDTIKLGLLPKDQAFELVWHLVPSTGSNGILEVWMNGSKRPVKSGRNTTGTTQQYYKNGVYKWNYDPNWSPQATSSLREFYIDDYEWGQEGVTTFEGITLWPQAPPPPVNQLPVVTVQETQVLSNEKARGMLSGTATDSDGTIASYAWTQLSGPSSAIIISPSSATTAVEGLVPGIYVFRLTATDDDGGQSFADTQINVKQNFSTTSSVKPKIGN